MTTYDRFIARLVAWYVFWMLIDVPGHLSYMLMQPLAKTKAMSIKIFFMSCI